MKPDIIVSWPRNCDYPVWRQFIHDNRDRFNVIIVVFTETHAGEDYREFVKKAMLVDYVLCADSPVVKDDDWRNVAVNHGLLQSYNAQWVWFTEQDFIPKEGFWEIVDAEVSIGVRAIGVRQGDRLHPCSLMIRRDLLNALDKNFGIVTDKLDHFGLIQQQLEESKEPVGIIPEKYWQHMNGLSHNFRLISEGQMPNYEPEAFEQYIHSCIDANVPKDPRFTKIIQAYLAKVRENTV